MSINLILFDEDNKNLKHAFLWLSIKIMMTAEI